MGRPEREQAPERASAEGSSLSATGRPERERVAESASAEHRPLRGHPLAIAHTESSLGWGGQEIRTLTEAAGFIGRGHHVTLYAAPGSRIAAEAARFGVPVATLPIGRKRPAGVRSLVAAFRRHPVDVVCMGSEVEFRDDTTGRVQTVTLVYPNEANIAESKISVLTPIGTALIGLHAGKSINWETRRGDLKRLTVLQVREPSSFESFGEEVEAAVPEPA